MFVFPILKLSCVSPNETYTGLSDTLYLPLKVKAFAKPASLEVSETTFTCLQRF